MWVRTYLQLSLSPPPSLSLSLSLSLSPSRFLTLDDDYPQDQVKVYSHEGDGENTEHLISMDLHDVKTEMAKDAENAEVGVGFLDCKRERERERGGERDNYFSLIQYPAALFYAVSQDYLCLD